MNKTEVISDVNDMAKAISRLLKKKLNGHGHLKCRRGTLQLVLSHPAFELEMGSILQTTQQAIDQAFPVRRSDILLLISDASGNDQLRVKIWHTHPKLPQACYESIAVPAASNNLTDLFVC